MTRRSFSWLAAILLALPSAIPAAVEFTVQVPTPREHYESYDVEKETLELLAEVMGKLDPETRAQVMGFMQSGQGPEALPPVEPDQALEMIEKLGLREYKPRILEIFIHKSQVLELCPPEHAETVLPILHDALMAFLDGLSDERIAERLVTMSRVPPDTERGEKILILASKIPTLQKLGQIIARVEAIPPDVRVFLQTLESGISTMTRDELVDDIVERVGPEAIERYQIRFDDKILAEASVGAVIKCSFVLPGDSERDDMVAKLIKPYVATGLPQEMEILDALIDLVTEHAAFYHLEGIPVRELFQQIRDKLAEELLVTREQANFKRAGEYFDHFKGVDVPDIYPFSTQNVTFMEFFHGEKISDAFPGDTEKRALIARRLADVMSYDSLFSKAPASVFHGDPHAGNVMHITDDPNDPYKIGLIDWGLLGSFDRPHRLQMLQLSLAVKYKSRKKLRKSVGALLDGGLPDDPEKQQEIFGLADKCLEEEGGKSTYEIYSELLAELTKRGYVMNPNLSLYIKSQLTLAGIYRELDPSLKLDKYVENKVASQVKKELPKRLLLLPAVGNRNYRSMLTNGEVLKELFN